MPTPAVYVVHDVDGASMTTTIIASDAEVRAWLAGATSLRRPVKPQPTSVERWKHGYVTPDTDARYATLRDATGKGWANCGPFRCLWQPGDVLRVREVWQAWQQESYEHDEWRVQEWDEIHRFTSKIEYRATSESVGPWRSAATMPACASRMSIRVTGVGIERGDGWEWVVNFERVEVV